MNLGTWEKQEHPNLDAKDSYPSSLRLLRYRPRHRCYKYISETKNKGLFACASSNFRGILLFCCCLFFFVHLCKIVHKTTVSVLIYNFFIQNYFIKKPLKSPLTSFFLLWKLVKDSTWLPWEYFLKKWLFGILRNESSHFLLGSAGNCSDVFLRFEQKWYCQKSLLNVDVLVSVVGIYGNFFTTWCPTDKETRKRY